MTQTEKGAMHEVGADSAWIPEFVAGQQAVFTATAKDYAIYNGPVTVVRQLTIPDEVDEEVGPMYECATPLGSLFHVFEDELRAV